MATDIRELIDVICEAIKTDKALPSHPLYGSSAALITRLVTLSGSEKAELTTIIHHLEKFL